MGRELAIGEVEPLCMRRESVQSLDSRPHTHMQPWFSGCLVVIRLALTHTHTPAYRAATSVP